MQKRTMNDIVSKSLFLDADENERPAILHACENLDDLDEVECTIQDIRGIIFFALHEGMAQYILEVRDGAEGN